MFKQKHCISVLTAWTGLSSTPLNQWWLNGPTRSKMSWRKTRLSLCLKASTQPPLWSWSSGRTRPWTWSVSMSRFVQQKLCQIMKLFHSTFNFENIPHQHIIPCNDIVVRCGCYVCKRCLIAPSARHQVLWIAIFQRFGKHYLLNWTIHIIEISCCFQLRDPKVRKMAELLEKTGSSYFLSFKEIFRDCVAGKHT